MPEKLQERQNCMLDYVTGVLGGLSPRRLPREESEARLFDRMPALQSIRDVTTTADGSVWVAADAGLYDVVRNRLLALPDNLDTEKDGLDFVAGENFLIAGGRSGLWWLTGSRLEPIEPREAVLALAANQSEAAAVTRNELGTRFLRVCQGPNAPWFNQWTPSEDVQALAYLDDGTLIAGGSKLWRISGRGRAQEFALPEGCQSVQRIHCQNDQIIVWDGRNAWGAKQSPDWAWDDLKQEGGPGDFRGSLAFGGIGNLRTSEGSSAVVKEAPKPFQQEVLVPAGTSPAGDGIAFSRQVLLEGGKRKWRPALVAGLAPGSARSFQRTRGGALWVTDQEGRPFHLDPQGIWSGVRLPGDLRATGRSLGTDGEALLMPAFNPDREEQPQETLFWVAAPRGEEIGTVLLRNPRPISLGALSGRSIQAVAGLGTIVFAAVGNRIAKIENSVLEVWGTKEGLPEVPVQALEVMFDDLWVVCEGDAGPRRYPQGVADPDPIPGWGPSGEVVSLCADEDTGELWVGLVDGNKGGVASLSREGRWITQLRFRSPVYSIAASRGTVLASSPQGLFVLEEGERKRQNYGTEEGLPAGSSHAVGLAGEMMLVDTAWGLYRSRVEAWTPPEAGGLQV